MARPRDGGEKWVNVTENIHKAGVPGFRCIASIEASRDADVLKALQLLAKQPDADLRVLRLTRDEEKRLLQRLENLNSLSELHRMQERMAQQIGIQLTIQASPNEVRSLRGITILVHEQPGLCRKTRQAIPAAIKRSLELRPEITYEILNVGGLFESQAP